MSSNCTVSVDFVDNDDDNNNNYYYYDSNNGDSNDDYDDGDDDNKDESKPDKIQQIEDYRNDPYQPTLDEDET